MNTVGKSVPGIILSLIIGLCGLFFTEFIPYIGGITLAIIIGLVVGNVFKLNQQFDVGIKYSEKKILAYAIMLIGLFCQEGVI